MDTHTKHRDTVPHLDLSIITASQPSVIVQKGGSPEAKKGIKPVKKPVQEDSAPFTQV